MADCHGSLLNCYGWIKVVLEDYGAISEEMCDLNKC